MSCPVTTTVRTAAVHGDTLFFRCDREPNHEGRHHARQESGVECLWSLIRLPEDQYDRHEVRRDPGDHFAYPDPNFPDADLVAKIDAEFG